ncbi:MAG: Gfo/Idh/MocA family oxidoreductase, partial [Chitinophagaceae bacterium]|nr:Gfo/Idh/MocA family oxidoreductase [Chitinophagaceae bacterium]
MLKAGVFGAGHLGKFHIDNWQKIQDAELVGFYDPDDKTAEEVENKFGLKRFPTAISLLKEIDIADIVAPTNYHYELCEEAIKNDKHVFVEKPLAQTLEEGRKLLSIIKEAG